MTVKKLKKSFRAIIIEYQFLVYTGTLALSSSILTADAPAVPVFPGADGFGAYSQGGREGTVLHVTKLNDEDSDILHWAVEQEGSCTIVFEISGTVQLESTLKIDNPYITISGQITSEDRNGDKDEDGYTNLEEYINALCQ